jgi:hypothetical protein
MGSYENLVDAYYSMVKVKNMADIIVPLHEPKFIGIKRIPEPVESL